MIVKYFKNGLLGSSYKRKSILEKFRNQSAFNMDLAIKLDNFDRTDFPIINALKRKNIIVKVGFEDLYYLDEKKLLENRLNKTKWAMILLIILIAILYETKF